MSEHTAPEVHFVENDGRSGIAESFALNSQNGRGHAKKPVVPVIKMRDRTVALSGPTSVLVLPNRNETTIVTVFQAHLPRDILTSAMRTLLLVTLGLISVISVLAQNGEEVHHNNVTVGGGAAVPVGNSTGYLSTAPMFNVSYGYRFNRFFQADAGLNMAFGAANNQNPEVTDFGTVQGGDHEFMIPLGGRIILPLGSPRFEASLGGGGVYLHYTETAPSGGYDYGYSSGCYSCTSRGGWGGYGLGNVTYYLDQNRNFRIGFTAQYVAGSTNGQAVANIPALKTTDHWLNTFVEFGLSF